MALKILAVSSEAFPLAKTGGLGDAFSGMASAVHEMGASITIMLPAYKGVRKRLVHARLVGRLEGLPGGPANLVKGYCPESGLSVILLENDALYERDGLYLDAYGIDYPDSALRFAALGHAAARVAAGFPGLPGSDVLHAHDWHAALAPLALKQIGATHVRSVLTLHNIAFQGCFDSAHADQIGIDPALRETGGLLRGDHINFLHSGITCADKITVVSENYAREILTPEFGCGLQDLLRTRQPDTIAIANGIDASVWNPATDGFLRGCHFNVEDLSNKAACKRKLQARFGLQQQPDAVMLAMGSRLTGQKMADVAVDALPRALEAHSRLQVCVIGCGEKPIEQRLQELAQRYPGRCQVHIGYSEDIAHLLHAGADMLLHGSRFEPFGLTPLYAMRYGTIPIGSRVGGMVDTIHDPGEPEDDRLMHLATGLLFSGDHQSDMYAAIDRALRLHGNTVIWRSMQRNAMSRDYSWSRAAPSYLHCYQALCTTPEQTAPARTPAPATPVLAAARQIGMVASPRLQGLGLKKQSLGELAPRATGASAA